MGCVSLRSVRKKVYVGERHRHSPERVVRSSAGRTDRHQPEILVILCRLADRYRVMSIPGDKDEVGLDRER